MFFFFSNQHHFYLDTECFCVFAITEKEKKTGEISKTEK